MRQTTVLDKNWIFYKNPDSGEGENVTLPHTWNAVDGQDGGNDYYRGTCKYACTFEKPEMEQNGKAYLEFDGAAMTADVFVNGAELFHHEGGYSRFRVDVTEHLKEQNQLEVLVDNSDNTKVYPQKADFTFYGGLYRMVKLVTVPENHFCMEYAGSNGIKVTPEVTILDAGAKKADAEVTVELWIEGKSADVMVMVGGEKKSVPVEHGYAKAVFDLTDVHLWDGVDDPYLYTAKAELSDGDSVETTFGCRSFSIDPQKGFFLNGRSYPLRGVSRHQDRAGAGNALTNEMHREDMEIIKELGANTIRLAHYQHAQKFYDLCDENGMIVWAEIPYITMHMSDGTENTLSQMRELVVQNYNHPSIVVWGVSNEITISTKDKKDMLDNHHVLNDLCHKMDPTRLTTLACYAMCGPFNRSAHITDLVGWNLYLGWYVPGFFLNDLFLRFFHLVFPNRPIGYSEYGAEGMPNLHSGRPRRGDHTEEYQARYHEYMLRCFERHPFMWSTYVWNMFDFAADARNQGGEPGMNHKGLVTFDRKTKKDSFFLYKAYWSEEPFVHLCGSRRSDRSEDTTTIKVYTNQPVVSLYNNGELIEQKSGNHIFTFQLPMEKENKIEAVAGSVKDAMVLHHTEKENPDYKLKKEAKKSENWV